MIFRILVWGVLPLSNSKAPAEGADIVMITMKHLEMNQNSALNNS